jgi:hypothetical protein
MESHEKSLCEKAENRTSELSEKQERTISCHLWRNSHLLALLDTMI